MEWKPSERLQKKFPYYLSGYDYEGSPGNSHDHGASLIFHFAAGIAPS